MTHHAEMSAAAAFAGGDVAPDVAASSPLATRSFAALVRENAVEGCARETFGALLACWQAATAGDPALRRLMTGIASDETAHAALSWQIHGWAADRLAPAQRRRVTDELRAAFAELEQGAAAPLLADAGERAAFGLPVPEIAVGLARALGHALTAAA